jgi:hypothetical protein
MCLRRAPEKYIAGAALDRAALEFAQPLTEISTRGRSRVERGLCADNLTAICEPTV